MCADVDDGRCLSEESLQEFDIRPITDPRENGVTEQIIPGQPPASMRQARRKWYLRAKVVPQARLEVIAQGPKLVGRGFSPELSHVRNDFLIHRDTCNLNSYGTLRQPLY